MKPLNKEPGETEHDGIDCCWSAIYGLGCDKGERTMKESIVESTLIKGLLTILERIG